MKNQQEKDRSLLYIGITLSIVIVAMGYLTFFTDDPSVMLSKHTRISTIKKHIKAPPILLKKNTKMTDGEIKQWLVKFIDAFYYDQNKGYFDPPSYFATITETFYNYHNLTLNSVLEIHNKRLANMRHLKQYWTPSSLEYTREGTLLVVTYDLQMDYFEPSVSKQQQKQVEIEIAINKEGKIVSLLELSNNLTSSVDAIAPYDSLQHKLLQTVNKLYNINTVTTVPEFIGDVNALQHYIETNLKYPDEAKKHAIEGKVYLGFIIEKNGSLSNIEIINGLGYGCDAEAIRVLKNSPPWKPGTFKGNPVRTTITLGIKFQLSD